MVTILLVIPTKQPVVYTNISRNFRTCLFTTDPAAAAPIWQAVQQAAADQPINAQRFTAPHGTPADLTPYLNGLIATKCKLIVAVGTDLHDTVSTVASANPSTEFINIGSTTALSNIHDLPADPHQIRQLVLDAAHKPPATTATAPSSSTPLPSTK
ncbi:hypothetical protein [Gandjariella thermophila]|uniref:hypothetical protein n=1 Tax=Gandjariella thermophila TaxID=1931992 RepID=UPI0010F90E67|nr:hypothetical protein [Gandjariella thermophila]